MGKSSKKIKSDRINALRKQYDAFLEEDKKRKERNEYILGRLDNMRYSSTMLPIHSKLTVIPDRNATLYRIGYQPEKGMLREHKLSYTNRTQIVPDISVGNVEETVLIQELSKKYILIPKQRQSFINSAIQDAPTLNAEPVVETNLNKEIKVSDEDSPDWKSKYEILNILKKEEKGETPIRPVTSILNEQNKSVSNDNNIGIINKPVIDDADSEKGQKYVNEVPENLSQKLSFKESNDYDPSADVNDILSKDESVEKDIVYSDMILKDQISENDYKLQHTNLEYNSEFPGSDQTVTNHDQSIEIQPKYDLNITSDNSKQQTVENKHLGTDNAYNPEIETSNIRKNDFAMQNKDIASTENITILDDEIAPIQIINSNDIVKEEVVQAPPSMQPESNFENIEYPIDIINVQEFTPNKDVPPKDGTSINAEEHTMQQEQLMSPNQEITQLTADTEQQQDPSDVSGIEEFETEQQNMFYSEQTGENNAYQSGAGENYNPEYAQNEPYQQNEEYTYYEGTQPEVYQPVDVNEHQETSQNYDQNYEQQYVNSYDQGYEQEPYEHREQEYQETQVYPTQPEVDQLHYQQQNEETVEHVQQVLDGEQGYTEIQNIVEANEADNTLPVQKQQMEAIETTTN